MRSDQTAPHAKRSNVQGDETIVASVDRWQASSGKVARGDADVQDYFGVRTAGDG